MGTTLDYGIPNRRTNLIHRTPAVVEPIAVCEDFSLFIILLNMIQFQTKELDII